MSALWHDDGRGWQLLAAAGFSDEAALHDLVEEAPHVLPLSGSPKLVVVGREVRLGGGYADLVAIEPNGRIALIEVKLARNAEARRAVVAQVLAYAAVLFGQTAGDVENDVLREHLGARGFTSLADVVAAQDQDGMFDPETFSLGLSEGLSKGSFRVVLVLDEVPSDLVRLVGYLESVTDGLVVDLITVAAYDVGGSRILVPQRVEPERQRAEVDGTPTRSTARSLITPGAADFRVSIETAAEEHRGELARLCDWAESLEQEGLATVTTRHDKRGWKVLRPRIKGDDAGLITIWNEGGPGITFWRTVFDRRAPNSIEAVERALLPETMGQTARRITDELLSALTSAYREAAVAPLPAPEGGGNAT